MFYFNLLQNEVRGGSDNHFASEGGKCGCWRLGNLSGVTQLAVVASSGLSDSKSNGLDGSKCEHLSPFWMEASYAGNLDFSSSL